MKKQNWSAVFKVFTSYTNLLKKNKYNQELQAQSPTEEFILLHI